MEQIRIWFIISKRCRLDITFGAIQTLCFSNYSLCCVNKRNRMTVEIGWSIQIVTWEEKKRKEKRKRSCGGGLV